MGRAAGSPAEPLARGSDRPEPTPARQAGGQRPQGWIAFDAHAHLHPCFSLARALDAAFGHAAHATDPAPHRPRIAALALADPAGQDSFAALRDGALPVPEPWNVRPTAEPASLVLCRPDCDLALVLIAGRQVATRERLEVLALGRTRPCPDGRPLDETVDAVVREGAVAVVPWGFGKWWGRRARLVARLIADLPPAAGFFLGDNGGRPRYAPAPRLFAAARRRRIYVLPGSDPLPFPEEAARVGSYGCLLQAPLDLDRPWAALRHTLEELDRQPLTYGRRQGAGAFVVHQLRMQALKRERRTP